MKPVIGVTCDFDGRKCTVDRRYCRAVEAAGGMPLILPQPAEGDLTSDILRLCAGIVLTGGPDVHPQRYGALPHSATKPVADDRDACDFRLMEEIKRLDKPMLAICYGAQALNVAFGGDLYQDIPDELPASQAHHFGQDMEARHPVRVERESLLHRVLGVDEVLANSFHHQAIRRTAVPLRQVAFSRDDVVEAVESAAHRFLLGIQWHPERLFDEELHLKLFRALIEEAAK